MSDNTRIDELRKHRAKVLNETELMKRRERCGQGIVDALAHAIGAGISLSDFHVDKETPFPVDWPERLNEARGLVAAYITKERAKDIAACIQANLFEFRGLVGIYGNEFLGLSDVSQVSITGMIEACEAANDSVVFYPSGIQGAIVFDCYKSPPGTPPFSVLIQGSTLTELLSDCIT